MSFVRQTHGEGSFRSRLDGTRACPLPHGAGNDSGTSYVPGRGADQPPARDIRKVSRALGKGERRSRPEGIRRLPHARRRRAEPCPPPPGRTSSRSSSPLPPISSSPCDRPENAWATRPSQPAFAGRKGARETVPYCQMNTLKPQAIHESPVTSAGTVQRNGPRSGGRGRFLCRLRSPRPSTCRSCGWPSSRDSRHRTATTGRPGSRRKAGRH